MMKLTKEEKNAITSLRRLVKRWPKSLKLLSASGNLCVMKERKDSVEVMELKTMRCW